MEKVKKEELLDSIEEKYGFKRELIKNPELHGLWFVSFEVKGIRYNGNISFHGALPQIHVSGYAAEHYNECGTPVEDWYYDEFIKEKKARLLYCADLDGEWEDTGIRFKDQREAQKYMDNLDKGNISHYMYEMIQEEQIKEKRVRKKKTL